MAKSFTPCAFCDEKSTTTCRRCGARTCGFHGPFDASSACRRCEDAWDAAKRARRIAVAPALVIGLGLGALVAAGIAVLMHVAHVDLGLGVIGLAIGVPTAIGLAALRRAERALRRRFLATPPPAAATRADR